MLAPHHHYYLDQAVSMDPPALNVRQALDDGLAEGEQLSTIFLLCAATMRIFLKSLKTSNGGNREQSSGKCNPPPTAHTNDPVENKVK